MAISHLLQAKQRFHLRRIGFPKPTRCCSSTSSKEEGEKYSQWKKAGPAREQKAMVVESYVKKYMEIHPGVFPKATHVQNEVGGSWYTLKGILQNLKDKIMGNAQLQNHPSSDTSNSTADPTASMVITSHNNSPDKTELGDPKITMINKMNDSADPTELPEATYIVPSSESGANSHSNENNLSAGEISDLVGENFSEDIVELDGVSDSSKLVEAENEHTLREELSDILLNYDKDSISKSEKLKPLVASTLQEVTAQKLHSTGCGNQRESKMTTSTLKINLGSGMGKKMASFSDTQKVTGLIDIIMEKMNGQPSVKHKNGHMQSEETLQDVLVSYETDLKSRSEQLSSLNHFSPNVVTTTFQEDGANKTTVVSEEGEMSESFDGAHNIMGLTDLFMKTTDIQNAAEVTMTKNDILTPNRLSENSKETNGEFGLKSEDVNALISCIKELPREQYDHKGKQTSLNGHSTGKKGVKKPGLEAPFNISHVDEDEDEDEEGGDSDFAAFDNTKSKSSQLFSLPTSEKDLNKTRDAFSADEVSDKNKVIVRFLPKTAAESEVVELFKNCGDITRIEFSLPGRSLFKDAYIYFKTREGMEKVLEKTDLMVRHSNITVETASSMENVSNRILIPNLVGDPDAPAALVKNPTRTVVIKQLTRDICSHHIEEALAFCNSNISGCFLGSTSSAAYVEFETEDGKERALAKHSISVLGKRLSIFRIDAPRTTVIRISNINFSDALNKVYSICGSCGKVLFVKPRLKGIMDVQFKLVEWPNMLKILNRLNGMRVEGHQLVAQPATVFPSEILSVLWNQTDGRRHVKTVMRHLLQNIVENAVDEAGLTDLGAKLRGDEFFTS